MIIFPHIPKTAGTTLKFILRNNFGRKHIDAIKTLRSPYTRNDLEFAQKIFRNPVAITGHNLVDPVNNLADEGDKLITILRNPVIRCVSHYQDDMVRGNIKLSFAEWIGKEENQNLSVKIIAGSDDLEKAKLVLRQKFLFVGITENFSDSLKLLKLCLDIPLNLLHRKLIVARDNTIKEKLLKDPASVRLLEQHNELDQQLYDYVLQEIFLPSVKAHTRSLQQITVPPPTSVRRNETNLRKSVRFNKFVYRQLIKITGK
ncbi:MAG: sulfotransferase family 2 domain-containing protein [Bacteroidales bacterium]